MEKQASNTFVGGLNTDRHPLTAQNTELIDAQNIDLIQVGEGYQLIMQKREGNVELLYDDGLGGDPVSAGLATGFIPLAMEEFNNLAYIVSVNPTTGAGELGTFPSPDYDAFVYVPGVTPTVQSVGSPTWDPRINPPEYEFSLISPLDGTDEEIHGDVPTSFTKAGFTISNSGILSDSYLISFNSEPAIAVYFDSVLSTTNIVTVPPGGISVVRFEHIKPYTKLGSTPYYAAETVHNVTATITSQYGPTHIADTYDFIYHLDTMIQVAYEETPGTTSVDTIGYDNLHIVPMTGGTKIILWTTNNSALTAVSVSGAPPFRSAVDPYPPATSEGDAITTNATSISITFGVNGTAGFRITNNAIINGVGATATVLLYAEQTN